MTLPQRFCARLLVVDPDGRLLLFRYENGREQPFWATPGGQLLPGETFEQAAARELAEETGFAAPIGPLVRTREAVFTAGDVGPARWTEHYFVVRTAAGAPERSGWTDEERRTIRDTRWWSLAELRGRRSHAPHLAPPRARHPAGRISGGTGRADPHARMTSGHEQRLLGVVADIRQLTAC